MWDVHGEGAVDLRVPAFNNALVRDQALDPRGSVRVRIRSQILSLSKFARSGIVREIVRPSLHQDPTSIEQVRSCVGGLDLAPDGMRQARLGNFARLAHLPAPVAE